MKRKQPKNSAIKIKQTTETANTLYERIAILIRKARATVMRAVDTTMVKTYWHIGQHIVEEEQKGATRAVYGRELLKTVSTKLNHEFGRGFGVDTLEDMRKFYLAYPSSPSTKSGALRRKLEPPKFHPNLSWTHYRELMRIKRLDARSFYDIEATKNRWSSRELERQINSLLFDRLAKSKDKAGLLKLVCQGQEISRPEDAIKDPLVLEFLDIPEAHQLTETKLEDALIHKLQYFLLELGKGFAFIARQRRLTLDGKHYYADLVFYHAVLKCHIIIELLCCAQHKRSYVAKLVMCCINYFSRKFKPLAFSYTT